MPPSSIEQLKLIATTLNGLGLGIAGLGIVRPLVDRTAGVSYDAVLLSVGAFIALHLFAQYILSYLR